MSFRDINNPESDFTPSYIPKFKNPKQFADAKIKMLKKQFYIRPTTAEIAHLYSLQTEHEINAAVRAILDNHWK